MAVLIVRPQVSPQLMRHDMQKRELEQTPLRDGGAAIVGMKGSHRTVAAATMVGMDLSAVGCIFLVGCCDDGLIVLLSLPTTPGCRRIPSPWGRGEGQKMSLRNALVVV